jgi:hypothetical protein
MNSMLTTTKTVIIVTSVVSDAPLRLQAPFVVQLFPNAIPLNTVLVILIHVLQISMIPMALLVPMEQWIVRLVFVPLATSNAWHEDSDKTSVSSALFRRILVSSVAQIQRILATVLCLVVCFWMVQNAVWQVFAEKEHALALEQVSFLLLLWTK